MTLPTIYEDAISCFCPRTAKMMRRCIANYLCDGKVSISSRICNAPRAVLMLIIENIMSNKLALTAENCSQTAENCSLTAKKCSLTAEKCSLTAKKCSLTEEETKEKLSDEKNKTLLPPTPPINKTIKAENGKEKKEENSTTTAATTRAREEISADTENTNSVGLKTDGQEAKTSEPKTQGVTTEKKKEADEEKC